MEAALDHKLKRLHRELRRRKANLHARQEGELREVTSSGTPSKPTAAEVRSFAALERQLGGEVGAVIGGPPRTNSPLSFGNLQSGVAWSTSKVPISLRVLQDVGGPSNLSASQDEAIRLALTLSDNEAAAALFADLEQSHGGVIGASAAVEEVLAEAGDEATHISTQGRDEFSTYGQTEWSLLAQHQFMSQLAGGCVASPASREYVMQLMGEVSSDTWGLGSAGVPAIWKGGWGPGVDGQYLVRQMGVFYLGDREAVVTLAAIPDDGQFESAQTMATDLAGWLAYRAEAIAAAPRGC